jgi:hypothetical protein
MSDYHYFLNVGDLKELLKRIPDEMSFNVGQGGKGGDEIYFYHLKDDWANASPEECDEFESYMINCSLPASEFENEDEIYIDDFFNC